MNRLIIRRQFRQYRERIRQLQERITGMEQEAEASYFYHEEAESRAIRRVEACRREQAERERQAEADRWYRESELRDAVKNLERAQSYGDEWAIANATRKLKSLNY